MSRETYGFDKVFNSYLDVGSVGYVKAIIIEVVDYDNNKWTNDSWMQWYLDNYDKNINTKINLID